MEEMFLAQQMELAKQEEEQEAAALRGVKANVRAKRTMTQKDLLTYSSQVGGKSPKRIVKHGQKVVVLDEGAIQERTVSTFGRDSQIVAK